MESKKIAIVTGITSEIGQSIIKNFLKEDYIVVTTYNSNLEKASSIKEEILKEFNGVLDLEKLDLQSEEEIKKFVKKSINKYQKIDVLVNNAAICIDTLFSDKTKDNFMKTIEVNVVGTFLLSRLVGEEMAKNKNGNIINISSTNGIDKYYPMCLDYDASKAALNSLTHNLSLAFAPYVRVNAIAPGFIKTEKEVKDLDDEYLESEKSKIFLHRLGEVEEINSVVMFLASDASSYINNTIIRVDGGTYNG